MEGTFLTVVVSLALFVSGLVFQTLVLGKWRIKFSIKQLKRFLKREEENRFYTAVNKHIAGTKNHFLGLRFFTPLVATLGFSWFTGNQGMAIFGCLLFGLGHFLGRKRLKSKVSLTEVQEKAPWKLMRGGMEKEVIQLLAAHRDSQSRELLGEWVHHTDPLIARLTIVELIRVQKPWAVPLLAESADSDPENLILLPRKKSFEQDMNPAELSIKMVSKRAGVKITWMPLLLRLDPESREKSIQRVLNDPEESVRKAAQSLKWQVDGHNLIQEIQVLLPEVKDADEKHLLEELVEWVENGIMQDFKAALALSDLWRLSPEKIPQLVNERKAANELALFVIRQLKDLPTEAAFEALFSMLAHPNGSCIDDAFKVLENKTDLTPEHLAEAAIKYQDDVVFQLPELATRFSWKSIVSFYPDLLHHKNDEIRFSAVTALEFWKEEEALDELIPLVKDPSRSVRSQVFKTLEKRGNLQAVEILIIGLEAQYHASGFGLRAETDPEEVSTLSGIITSLLKPWGGRRNFPLCFVPNALPEVWREKPRGFGILYAENAKRLVT